MKNLENYGVQEMNAKEIRETDGGFIPLVVLGVKIGADAVATLFVLGAGIGGMVAQAQDK